VIQNPFDRRPLRSVSPNIPPHSLVFNYIIELPFGKGRRYLNDPGLMDRLVGGWQVTGIHRYRSGPALTPFLAGGQRDFLQLVGYLGNLRPNITGQPFYTDIPAGGVNYLYLNPGPFSRDGGVTVNPAYIAYHSDPLRFFGNAAPTYGGLRAQPFFTEDFSLMKK